MKHSVCLVLLICSSVTADVKLVSKRNSVDGCMDWSVDLKSYMALAGEPVRMKCALFYSYIRTTYNMAQSAGLRLMWYKTKGDVEEPILFSVLRMSKDDDSIWIHTAEVQDSGLYTCVLRNSTYCMKVSMPLVVAENDMGLCYNSRLRYWEQVQVTKKKQITCPDVDDYKTPNTDPEIVWYKECKPKTWRSSIIQKGKTLLIQDVQDEDAGNYTCELKYEGRPVRRTVQLKVTALVTAKPPQPLFPVENQPSVIDVQLGRPLTVFCRAFFGFTGDNAPQIYWMRGDKFIEELENHIKEGVVRLLKEHLGEKEVELALIFDIIQEKDLGNYSCHVENKNGHNHATVILRTRGIKYNIELAGGLGAILLVFILFVIIYKCYNIELMLFYRQNCGSDEAAEDNKEYDAYLSYTKVDPDSLDNETKEEEQFALEILPDILEKQYGYKLFIPDRDMIPSGTYMEDLARCVEQSRRLIIVLTPDYVIKRGWSIFVLDSRLHNMLTSGEIKVILIECTNLRGKVNYQEVESLKHAIRHQSLIKWNGPKSSKVNSKFWKNLVYEMPAKRREVLSRQHVMDSGEQSLFGDLQTVPSIAVTGSSGTLPRSQGDMDGFHPVESMQMRHFCRAYEFDKSTSPMSVSSLGNHHTYCNIPLTILNGQLNHGSAGKDPQEFQGNNTFLPVSSRELSFTSDIW
ncbi:X-linked interleukin-1 receptor accessory protein-like 2 [Spea bombifrons]|uniref:X-linked interleukin-1 receptor accessory protein-like 2 n=1 Tax=Spea bombifrons TaxID=233779 RepID=UPI0023497244|nr:X-linked interleukin-1 receptor accessory protein-like 2 [Spea bombifrons]